MKDNGRTIRSTEWQTKGSKISWTRIPKDRESWRTLAEGYFLQWKDTAYNTIE